MGFRTWFRRNRNNDSTDTTTIEGDSMAESKTLKIAVTVNGKQGIYQTARRAQGHLDDIDVLTDGARLLSRKLSKVEINDQRAVVAILAQAAGSEDLAEELEELFEDMAAGYGVAVKKPAKVKAPADPTNRLDAVVSNAELMKSNVVLVLSSALEAAFDGNRKQITAALNSAEIPAHLVEALLPATGPVAAEAEPEQVKEPVSLKTVNGRPVKAAEPVSA